MSVDLNADLGESFGRWRLGDDDGVLEVVTSANIACGFHAGDPLTMLRVLERAAERGVVIGAHVAYRDLAGFGRRDLGASPAELRGDVLYQLAALDGLARTVGVRVRYVKPHGALYNRIQRDPVHAQAVVDAVAAFDRGLGVLGMPGSVVLRLAEQAGLPVHTEAFADRGYASDGSLVPRSEPDAVLLDPADVAAQAVRLAVDGSAGTADGGEVHVLADSICVHTDVDGALPRVRAARQALDAAGVAVAPFAR